MQQYVYPEYLTVPRVMSLTPFIKCTCITGDDLKKHDCLFSNPVKTTISYCDLVYANVLSYEINIVQTKVVTVQIFTAIYNP